MADTVVKQEEIVDPIPKEESEDNATEQKIIGNEEGAVKLENRECVESIGNDELYSKISREDFLEVSESSNTYITSLETKLANLEAEIIALKGADTYQKQRDPTYREKILLRKLALKDQEIQDYAAQINELKAAQIPALATLKSTLLDPAINIIIQRLKKELTSTKATLEETQNELSAWKFTPDSNTGKRLMAKCRMLHQENEELGKSLSNGRFAKIEGELALQKSFNEEVKKSQFELDELLQDLDEDVEGMQGTIYYLQNELKKSKDKIAELEGENQKRLKLVGGQSLTLRKEGSEGSATVADDDLIKTVAKAEESAGSVNAEDESSDDSSCLILKVNPEEEYESMFNDEMTKTEGKPIELKTKKRSIVDEDSKGVSPKKAKRLSNSKKEVDED